MVPGSAATSGAPAGVAETELHEHHAWTRHAGALADAIIDDPARRGQPVDLDQASVLGRFVLESLDLASVSPDPRRALAAAFALLGHGWASAPAG